MDPDFWDSLTFTYEHHPEKVVPPYEPVTDEEVAEVFGLSLPLERRSTRKI